MSAPLVIWGASGHARVAAAAAEQSGLYHIVGFLDDLDPERWGTTFCGHPVLGGREHLASFDSDVAVHVGIGSNRARLTLAGFVEASERRLATVVHPAATVDPSAVLGAGTLVAPGAVINPGAVLGRGVIVNTSSSVDHDCALGDGVHVGPGVHLGGAVRAGEGVWFGIGATVSDHLSVGAWTTVGAGAVVVRDLPAQVVAYGVPATPRRRGDDVPPDLA